ncbi:ribonuclease H-like domain-containing protein [Tanacetum coccineum]
MHVQTITHIMVTRAESRISKPLERDELSCGSRPTNVNVVRLCGFPGISIHAGRFFNILYASATWFWGSYHPDYVCLLQRLVVLGLRQCPFRGTWFHRFTSFITVSVFSTANNWTRPIVFHRVGSDIAYLLLYVDDIILTASSTALLQRIITVLHGEFAMTDLGSLNYFLACSSVPDFTRPDISYAVQQLTAFTDGLIGLDALLHRRSTSVMDRVSLGVANVVAETAVDRQFAF